MPFLFGSAPKATFSTQPTIQPAQESILNTLSSILSNAFPYQQGGFGLGTTSLAALEAQAAQVPGAVTPEQSGINRASTGALTDALGYKPPQVSANAVTAPHIDATQAFQSGVVDPLTHDFLSRTLPAIAGQQGGSAGGAYSSGAANARGNAATDLERVLASEGSKFAYSAAGANQQADMTAGLANQSAGLTAGTANQSASINALRNVLAALGLAPSTATMPATELGANIGLSSATFSPYQQMISDLIAGSTGQTQQTLGVGSGGSTGLLGGLLGGIGSLPGTAGLLTGASGGSGLLGLGSLLFGGSDRRIKEDIEEIGSVDGFPLYRFKYKGAPGKHVGVMAQDIERAKPALVMTLPSGVKAVNYGAIVEGALREAA
jgi:hypothetical protein